MELFDVAWLWFLEHSPWAASALGVGGASSLLGKNLADKKQNKRLKAIEEDVVKLGHGLEKNQIGDENTAEKFNQLSKMIELTDGKIDKQGEKLDKLMFHLLENNK